MQFLPKIKSETDAVINISTGGGPGMTVDERIAAALHASPEMASLNMGLMNFIFQGEEHYFANMRSDIEEFAKAMSEKQKTQAGVIESANHTSRFITHRLDQASVDLGLELTDEELVAAAEAMGVDLASIGIKLS